MTVRAGLLSVAVVAVIGALGASTSTASAASTASVEWPAGAARIADAAGVLGTNISGLAPAGPASLWAVRDAPGELLLLDRVGDAWSPRAAWSDGRRLQYPDGHAGPDAEAVTTVDGDDGAVYVGAERDNSESSQRRNSVLRFDTAGTGPMQATAEWRLDDVVSASGANTGIEGLTWIADSALVAAGFFDRNGRTYVPAEHPPHRGGLFIVAVEQRRDLYVVMLTDDGRTSLIATIASGLPTAMELSWSAEHQELWAVCDNTCDGVASLLRLRAGAFEVVALVNPPAGLASLNDEGFVRLPCEAGRSVVVWADDVATDRHVLRESASSCGPFAELIVTSTTAPAVTVPPTTVSAPAGTGSTAPGSTAPGSTATGMTATGDVDSEGGGSGGVLLFGAGVGLAAVGGAALAWIRRRARGSVRPER